jgi:hypothetical protein
MQENTTAHAGNRSVLALRVVYGEQVTDLFQLSSICFLLSVTNKCGLVTPWYDLGNWLLKWHYLQNWVTQSN